MRIQFARKFDENTADLKDAELLRFYAEGCKEKYF